MIAWFTRYWLAAAFLGFAAGGALAQGSASPATCFDVLAGPSEAQPAGAILLNRCNGQTWILVRTYQAPARSNPVYRWSAIASDTADPKPPRTESPAATTGDKCFIFQGRRFCE
jgi:hypothetical protein